MRKRGDKTQGSAFQILRWKQQCRKLPDNKELKRKLGIVEVGRHEQYDRKSLELLKEVVYKRNTLAIFINSLLSVHAVSPFRDFRGDI